MNIVTHVLLHVADLGHEGNLLVFERLDHRLALSVHALLRIHLLREH